jgi:hypothetical protein
VTEAGTGDPISGATVEAAAQGDPINDRFTKTGSNGYYSMPVNSGETYDISVSAYGYYGQTVANITVNNPGETATTDFSLTAKATVSLTGTVTDGSGHGYPLYAHVTFESGENVTEAYTDPFDGSSAMQSGYETAAETGVSLSAPSAVRDYALTIGEYCEAPGYTILNGLYEPFDGETQPDGWTVTDDAGDGAVWRFDDPAGRGNITGGEGGFAIADSDHVGYDSLDTSLISPSVDFSGQSTVVLSFDQDLFIYSGSGTEVADVDVSVSGGGWQNVLRQTTTLRGPDHQSVDISGIAAGEADVRIRFHYYNASFDWWWQVDTIRIGPYTCGLEEGGGVMGFVTDARTGQPINDITVSSDQASGESVATPDDPALDDGFYWVFQPFAGASETVTFTVGGGVYIEKTVDVDLSRDAFTQQDVQLDTNRSFMPLLMR